jgi:hypothetical protein
MPRRPLRSAPEPLDVDAVSVVTAGTIAWGVAGLVLAVFGRGWMASHDTVWWFWTCVAGFGLGLLGVWIVRRRRARLGKAGAARGD